MQQHSNVSIEVLESHIAVSVLASDEPLHVADANQVLCDHPHPLVNQWIMLPDNHMSGVVWIRKRNRPFQLFYCAVGVTTMMIDQPTLPEPSISIRRIDGAAKHERLVDLPPISTLYVRRFMDEIFYARRLLTNGGTFSSKYWGVHHLETGIGLHPCASDSAAAALGRVSLELLSHRTTEEDLKRRLEPFRHDPTISWEDYLKMRTQPLSAFDARHRAVIKARRENNMIEHTEAQDKRDKRVREAAYNDVKHSGSDDHETPSTRTGTGFSKRAIFNRRSKGRSKSPNR